ncbi:hypothetical protein Dip510_000012 [Elusimicrobium posterum]|uniref:hypothetical protein n=1 Tax=Elusimicrobium posterum TaxID=3116653 RepID=UPI003C78A1AB
MKKLNIAVLATMIVFFGAAVSNAQTVGTKEQCSQINYQQFKGACKEVYNWITSSDEKSGEKNVASKAEKKTYPIGQAAKDGNVKAINNMVIKEGTDTKYFVEAYKVAADKETQSAIYDKLVEQIIKNAPSFSYAAGGEWFDGKTINGKNHSSWATIRSAAKDEADRLLSGIKKVASKAQIRKQQEEQKAAAKGAGTEKAKIIMSEETRAWDVMMNNM